MRSKYEFVIEDHEIFYRYPERYRVKPFRIFGNLFYVGNRDVGSYLIETGEGLILIDTTYPTTRGLLIQSIWESGHDPKDIAYILHTHGHFDHFGTTDLLVSVSGAKTFLGERDARMFRKRPELALIDCGKYAYLEPFIPDVTLQGGEEIKLGKTVVQAVATPGHTDGVMSYFFEVSDGKSSFRAGLHGGSGFNTLNRRYIEKHGNTHSRGEFIEGLNRVLYEKVDIILGNHAGQTNTLEKMEKLQACPEGANPFIDPGEWKTFIEDIEKRFNMMLEEEATGADLVELEQTQL
jgi:metallo-beta-lactamase class B